jgi:chemotaxis protein CheD
MKTIVVEMADCKLSDETDATLVTYALGSCVAVSIYDRLARIGAMAHIMLPNSSMQPARAVANPFIFADTGLRALFGKAHAAGLKKHRALVCLAGGAHVMDQNGVFNIGTRNHTAVRNILRKSGLMVHASAVGGAHSRTVSLDIATGSVWVREDGISERQLYPAGGNVSNGRAE